MSAINIYALTLEDLTMIIRGSWKDDSFLGLSPGNQNGLYQGQSITAVGKKGFNYSAQYAGGAGLTTAIAYGTAFGSPITRKQKFVLGYCSWEVTTQVGAGAPVAGDRILTQLFTGNDSNPEYAGSNSVIQWQRNYVNSAVTAGQQLANFAVPYPQLFQSVLIQMNQTNAAWQVFFSVNGIEIEWA